MKTLDAEIFAAGKWNGMTFTPDDLSRIADTFGKLGDKLRVALKMGHNIQQQMTDGHPALGWVEKIWVAGDKLMARMVDVPDVVYNAIQKKRYRNVSVELDVDVEHKGEKYPYVLTGVALLGADIPAVNTLADLTHYMGRGAAFSVGRRAVFSAIAGNQQGENIMTIEELTKKVAELTTAVATFTTQNAALAAENVGLKASVAKFEADAKAKAEAEAKASIATKRKEVQGLFEAGVKAQAITPAQREQFTKLLRVDDDAALAALDIAEVKALVGEGKKFSREQAKQGAGDGGGDLPADVRVVNEISVALAKGEAKDFISAQALVFSRNPQLAREYADCNDTRS